jgi:predicted Co/Zn/Cd cation transporter (cation efflux family)
MIIPYIDPVMMILISIYFLKLPLIGIRNALREVLEMTPSGKLPSNIKTYVKNMEVKYDMKESFVRIAKVGKTLWVEIDFVVKDSKKIKTIADQDKLRQELSDYIKTYDNNEWLTVSFTNNRKWAV